MTPASTTRPRTAVEINAAGIKALIHALGAADAARFLQQYGPGFGDYTAERDALIGEMTADEALTLVREHDDPA